MASRLERDEDGYIKEKHKRFIQLEEPKHPECYSLKECAAFQPWRVVLKVEPSYEDSLDMDFEPLDYEIFLRAPGPQDAQYTAHALFNIWEHVWPKIPLDDYPQISEGIPSEAEKLSEDQYKEFWREAQHYPHWPANRSANDNPTFFRFVKPGWDRTGGRAGHGNASIIVPDKSGIASVQAAKLAMDRKFRQHGGKK